MSLARPTPRTREPMPRLVARSDIQGLRAVAVLLVVVGHAGIPGFPGGYIGVDVFFVVSGYLISALLLREATTTGAVSISGFYAKRARRILPAATVVLVATTVFSAIALPFIRTSQIITDVLWSTFFAANIHFARVGTDYFAQDVPPSAVQHFWSLSVEEQFYLVWPTLVALVLVVAGSRAGRDAERSRRRIRLLTVVVAVATVLSFAWAAVLTQTSPTAAYFSTPARVWELGAGVLLALAGGLLPRIGRRVRCALATGGLVAVVAAAVTFDHATLVPGPPALLPVLGTVAILASGAGGEAIGLGRVLQLAPLRWVGDRSYSLYLWHWPFLILGSAYAGRTLELRWNLLLMAGAVVASALTYQFVENPVRRAASLRRAPRLSLALWPLATGSVVVAAVLAGVQVDRVEAALAAGSDDFSLEDVPVRERVARTGDRLHDDLALALDQATAGAPVPYPLAQDLNHLFYDVWSRDEKCAAGPEYSTHDICPAGDLRSQREVVLLGDSHADMWLPALNALGKERGFKVVPFIKWGCTPADAQAWRITMGGIWDECSDWREWALEQIEDLQPQAVIVGTATNMRMADVAANKQLRATPSADVWQDGMVRLGERLSRSADQVTILGDVMYREMSPAECLVADGATLASCTAPVDPRTIAMDRRLEAAAREAGVDYLDVLDMICIDGQCPLVVDRTVVYRDQHHLSRTYILRIREELEERLSLRL